VAARGAGLVVMHMRGTPGDMRRHTDYDDVVADVRAELAERLVAAREAGIAPDAIVADPGLGFAKTATQSLALLRGLDRLHALGAPLLVGPSRKSFLGAVLGEPPHRRVAGTVAACVLAYLRGARIVRVHDVEPVAQALAVAHAIETGAAFDAAPPPLATDRSSPS
ncbi:MAG: dihydropteroate synthase, partial [Longimicrobiales bacterium]